MTAHRRLREPVNAITHALGVLGGVAVLFIALSRGQTHWTVWVFALSMVVLYSASSVYHALGGSAALERQLKRLDHSAIFVLIAGTYTPVLYIALPDPWRWIALAVVWGIALTGIALKFSFELPEWLSLALYVLMGWLAVVLLPVLHAALPPFAFWALVAGGVFYTLGVPFFATKRRRHFVPAWGPHEVWHLFVLAGSGAHALMVLALPKV
jgi:hemolysin III